MSDRPEQPADDRDAWIRATARHFRYPPAPNIARRVLQRLPDQDGALVPGRPRRRVRWPAVLAVVAVIVLALLATPRVRAELRELLRIGRIRILLATPSPTPQAILSPTPRATPSPALRATLSPTPRATLSPTPRPAARSWAMREARKVDLPVPVFPTA
jgi:hypothetical protein